MAAETYYTIVYLQIPTHTIMCCMQLLQAAVAYAKTALQCFYRDRLAPQETGIDRLLISIACLPALFWLSSYVTSHRLTVAAQSGTKE